MRLRFLSRRLFPKTVGELVVVRILRGGKQRTCQCNTRALVESLPRMRRNDTVGARFFASARFSNTDTDLENIPPSFKGLASNTNSSEVGLDNFNTLAEAMEHFARLYRKDVWRDLPEKVEIWTGKETLTGPLLATTFNLGVGLFPCRGFASLSFLYETTKEIEESRKPTYIYYFGDHDPSGQNIFQTIQRELPKLAPTVEIYFERLAVTREQIQKWDLPTRPTKRSDPRSKNFKGDSVEVEAIKPGTLRALCRNAIKFHIPEDHFERMKMIEAEERRDILSLVKVVNQ